MKITIVCPATPQWTGKGYQRRALEIERSLSRDHQVVVQAYGGRGQLRTALKALVELARDPWLPLEVAWVRGSGHILADGVASDVTVYVTARAAPRRLPDSSVVDFVDANQLSAERRAAHLRGPARWVWCMEARRMTRWETGLAEQAAVTVAVAATDAAVLCKGTRVVPLALPARPEGFVGGRDNRIVFTGNLHFGPNEEAVRWICTSLAPALDAVGVSRKSLMVAGRGPRRALRSLAANAGIEMRPNVPNMWEVLERAAVSIAPVFRATGMQSKVLDAVAAGIPVVMSPVAAEGVPLRAGHSASVVELSPPAFAAAIAKLVNDPRRCQEVAEAAQHDCAALDAARVSDAWRSLVGAVAAGASVDA